MPPLSAPGSTRPPVTILCGFLGAGKTTLLNHLLAQAEGRRWAVVVNDVAALNIDAALVRQQTADTAATRDVVELGNGCVCCSSRDQLGETIAELAATSSYEHILVETTGVAEPRAIAALFTQKNPFGRTLADFATLSSLVTVIDAAHFLREWQNQNLPSSRVTATTAQRPLFELMVEQAECADLLILNKCDLVSITEREQLETILSGLNARAEIIRAEHSQVASELLLDRPRFNPTATLGSATWVRALNTIAPKAADAPTSATRNGGERNPRPTSIPPASPATSAGRFIAKPGGAPPIFSTSPAASIAPPAHEEKYGIRSFVYQSRRPFAQEKFTALLASGLPGLLRAKGFFWIAERPDEMGFLSVAGGVTRFDFLSYWWAAMVENGKASLDDRNETIRALWVEPHGDRRQELVFIGIDLDEETIRASLNACAATGS